MRMWYTPFVIRWVITGKQLQQRAASGPGQKWHPLELFTKLKVIESHSIFPVWHLNGVKSGPFASTRRYPDAVSHGSACAVISALVWGSGPRERTVRGFHSRVLWHNFALLFCLLLKRSNLIGDAWTGDLSEHNKQRRPLNAQRPRWLMGKWERHWWGHGSYYVWSTTLLC